MLCYYEESFGSTWHDADVLEQLLYSWNMPVGSLVVSLTHTQRGFVDPGEYIMRGTPIQSRLIPPL